MGKFWSIRGSRLRFAVDGIYRAALEVDGEHVVLNGRLFGRERVGELAAILAHFAQTGELTAEPPEPVPAGACPICQTSPGYAHKMDCPKSGMVEPAGLDAYMLRRAPTEGECEAHPEGVAGEWLFWEDWERPGGVPHLQNSRDIHDVADEPIIMAMPIGDTGPIPLSTIRARMRPERVPAEAVRGLPDPGYEGERRRWQVEGSSHPVHGAVCGVDLRWVSPSGLVCGACPDGWSWPLPPIRPKWVPADATDAHPGPPDERLKEGWECNVAWPPHLPSDVRIPGIVERVGGHPYTDTAKNIGNEIYIESRGYTWPSEGAPKGVWSWGYRPTKPDWVPEGAKEGMPTASGEYEVATYHADDGEWGRSVIRPTDRGWACGPFDSKFTFEAAVKYHWPVEPPRPEGLPDTARPGWPEDPAASEHWSYHRAKTSTWARLCFSLPSAELKEHMRTTPIPDWSWPTDEWGRPIEDRDPTAAEVDTGEEWPLEKHVCPECGGLIVTVNGRFATHPYQDATGQWQTGCPGSGAAVGGNA